MSVPAFVHLRVHSEYSLVNGIVRIPQLVKRAAAFAMPAVALTDQSNIFGAVKFYKKALAQGVQPIIGADVWVSDSTDPAEKGYSRLTLLCQDATGYKHLSHLITRSYLEGQIKGVPVIQREWLTQDYAIGLIALSGGMVGRIGQCLLNSRQLDATEEADYWQSLFPDRFYIELHRVGFEQEENYLYAATLLADEKELPVVATNSVHFIEQDDFMSHEAKTCINDGRVLADPRRPKNYTEQQYLKSSDAMVALFKDIPEAIENTINIAKRCAYQFTLGEYFLPQCPVPEGENDESYIKKLAQEGLEKRLIELFPDEKKRKERRQEYSDRLRMELDVINQMGFPGYFLIVADFVQWSKNNGVPVGPGRGSGAGSLVAYSLYITNLDPIGYELLFERFLNPERVSMPDFDIDFCMEDRDKVIRYVAEQYGRDHVSQIITYGSMAAKAVVRDVGRVLGHPYGLVDTLAKLIPFELGMTLEKALEMEPELKARRDEEEEVAQILNMAMSLEGLVRNAGKHAGGVVISPRPLKEFVPLYCEQGSDSIVSQFDKDDVEDIGLVKFDFLGLRTLTIIKWALKNIKKCGLNAEKPIDIDLIPLDDEKVYQAMKAGFTTAVFQLESRGMKELLKRLKPDCFEDIIALVALFRPGPLQSGMVDDFIDRKHGAKIEYPHKVVEPILQPTYGVILYQEQVMQIAQEMAGYSLGGADLLRRAMGKKKAEEMANQRSIFMQGASEQGIEKDTAKYVFDLMEKFAGYGFNKSHSAAYAMLSYQTAWLKVNYPAPFMAAVLSADMDNTDKVVALIDECGRMELEILPPDINVSEYRFSVENEGVRYGLGALKGVGQGVIDLMVEERESNGRFSSLIDICQRIDSSKLNKRTFESLIRSGALDSLDHDRAMMMAALEKAVKLGGQSNKDRQAGQNDLFGGAQQNSQSLAHDIEMLAGKDIEPWSDKDRLHGEKEVLGLYLSGHPLLIYKDEIARLVKTRIKDLRPNPDKKLKIAGCIMDVKVLMTKKQQKIAFVTLDDSTGKIDAAFFSKQYEQDKELLQKDNIIVVEGDVAHDDFSGGLRLRVDETWSLDGLREQRARGLEVCLNADDVSKSLFDTLEQRLKEIPRGSCPVFIQYIHSQYTGTLRLGRKWDIVPTEEAMYQVGTIAGVTAKFKVN